MHAHRVKAEAHGRKEEDVLKTHIKTKQRNENDKLILESLFIIVFPFVCLVFHVNESEKERESQKNMRVSATLNNIILAIIFH